MSCANLSVVPDHAALQPGTIYDFILCCEDCQHTPEADWTMADADGHVLASGVERPQLPGEHCVTWTQAVPQTAVGLAVTARCYDRASPPNVVCVNFYLGRGVAQPVPPGGGEVG